MTYKKRMNIYKKFTASWEKVVNELNELKRQQDSSAPSPAPIPQALVLQIKPGDD